MGYLHVSHDYPSKVLRSHDDMWKVTVLGCEVIRTPIHPIQFPIYAVEIEVTHAASGKHLVHLKLDTLLNQPLAHVPLRLTGAPHPIGGDRVPAIAVAGVVARPCAR